MSDYSGKNIFEKIGAFIPGYKGYSEKERRRDTDKLLRVEIAKYLDHMKETLNEIIRSQTDERKLGLISDLDRIKRNLDIAANQIRYASHGESGFFDVVQVNVSDLDNLYKYDLEIKEETEALKQTIRSLETSGNFKSDCSAIIGKLTVLSEKISDRDRVIAEVR
ncbi:MAG: hypothetical protein WCQ90_07455 [Deltaproteobacteria bacterium]